MNSTLLIVQVLSMSARKLIELETLGFTIVYAYII